MPDTNNQIGTSQTVNSQDEIHFGEEIQEQNGKRSQIFLSHFYNHKCNPSKTICNGRNKIRQVCIIAFPCIETLNRKNLSQKVLQNQQYRAEILLERQISQVFGGSLFSSLI